MPFRLILPRIPSKAHDCAPLFGSFPPRLKKKYHALIFKSDTSKILTYPVADGQSAPPSTADHRRLQAKRSNSASKLPAIHLKCFKILRPHFKISHSSLKLNFKSKPLRHIVYKRHFAAILRRIRCAKPQGENQAHKIIRQSRVDISKQTTTKIRKPATKFHKHSGQVKPYKPNPPLKFSERIPPCSYFLRSRSFRLTLTSLPRRICATSVAIGA